MISDVAEAEGKMSEFTKKGLEAAINALPSAASVLEGSGERDQTRSDKG